MKNGSQKKKVQKKLKNKLTLVFDDEKSKEMFVAWWLDGGGDGGGNLDWNTEAADKLNWINPKTNELRILGQGWPVDENGDPYDPNHPDYDYD